MLHILCFKPQWLDMIMNTKKFCVMRTGPRYDADIIPVVIYEIVFTFNTGCDDDPNPLTAPSSIPSTVNWSRCQWS